MIPANPNHVEHRVAFHIPCTSDRKGFRSACALHSDSAHTDSALLPQVHHVFECLVKRRLLNLRGWIRSAQRAIVDLGAAIAKKAQILYFYRAMHFESIHYDFPPFRPPNEANSALIRITRGCPWNRCEFCAMYKNLKFESKPLGDVKKDVLKARTIYGEAATIFLGDSDSLVHKNMVEIMTFIKETFPETQRVTSYARAKTILSRKMEFLKSVRAAGLDRLHLGLESGDPVVLQRLCKGATPEEMARAGQKAKKAGFQISFYVLSGAGGKDRWKEHAVNSAGVLNKAEPDFIRLRTLTIQHGTPLDEKLAAHEFSLTPPLERLEEVKLFIETLDIKDCFLASDHLTNYLWAGNSIIYKGVSGTLPDEKERMVATLARAINFIQTNDLEVKDSHQLYREGLISSL